MATPHRAYPLPEADKPQTEGLARLVAALAAIDVDVAAVLVALAQKAPASELAALVDIVAQIDGLKASKTGVTAEITAAIDALKGGAPAAYDTLIEIADKLADSDDVVATILGNIADETAARIAALGAKEAKWSAPAAYNAAALLDHQHIRATAAFSLDLATTTAAVGVRFRITLIGSGFTATLNGSGIRFRNKAGAWTAGPFILDRPVVTIEFVKVAATDWEMA